MLVHRLDIGCLATACVSILVFLKTMEKGRGRSNHLHSNSPIAATKAHRGESAQDSGSQPYNHGQEGERLSGLPLTARVLAAERDAAPVPLVTTVGVVVVGNKKTKDSSPTAGEDCRTSPC